QKSYASSLQEVIENLKPDIIHSMESQHGGYLVSGIIDRLAPSVTRPVWIHTTFGIDLDYYIHFPEHREKLKEMFSKLDLYIAEGKRDIEYAKALGYAGEHATFSSAGGGYRLQDFSAGKETRPSQRKLILVKGYQDSV